MTKQNIIDFLEWMNRNADENPMILETDNADIAEAYLSSRQEPSDYVCGHPPNQTYLNNGIFHCEKCGGKWESLTANYLDTF